MNVRLVVSSFWRFPRHCTARAEHMIYDCNYKTITFTNTNYRYPSLLKLPVVCLPALIVHTHATRQACTDSLLVLVLAHDTHTAITSSRLMLPYIRAHLTTLIIIITVILIRPMHIGHIIADVLSKLLDQANPELVLGVLAWQVDSLDLTV